MDATVLRKAPGARRPEGGEKFLGGGVFNMSMFPAAGRFAYGDLCDWP